MYVAYLEQGRHADGHHTFIQTLLGGGPGTREEAIWGGPGEGHMQRGEKGTLAGGGRGRHQSSEVSPGGRTLKPVVVRPPPGPVA